jgi:hypothetical protein
VVVAVVAVRVVKMAGYPIVHMLAVRHRFAATSGPVDMARLVPTAAVVRGAAVGVLARYLNHVLVDMTFVRMVEVTIVQVVGVAAVTYRGVSTTWPMLMRMVGMGWGGASRHETAAFLGFRCADAAARILRGVVHTSAVGESGPVRQGRPLGASLAPTAVPLTRTPFPRTRSGLILKMP